MQLLIAYARVDDPGCAQAAAALRLPTLEALLGHLAVARHCPGSVDTLNPPHEVALAQALGIPAADGHLPWAAWTLARSGHAPATDGWAWITPAHWEVGSHHVRMHDPQQLQVTPQEAHALLQAMAPWFAQDGIELRLDTPARWLARGPALATLASASLDRVIDSDLAPWMPAAPAMRRLQNEMQMLLHTHPVNEARSAHGLPTINAFWISGSGALPEGAVPEGAVPRGAMPVGAMPERPLRKGPSPEGVPPDAGPELADSLRASALRRDWAGWSRAWQEIDQDGCRRFAAALARSEDCELVLCSERHALHLKPVAPHWRNRLRRRFQPLRLMNCFTLL